MTSHLIIYFRQVSVQWIAHCLITIAGECNLKMLCFQAYKNIVGELCQSKDRKNSVLFQFISPFSNAKISKFLFKYCFNHETFSSMRL